MMYSNGRGVPRSYIKAVKWARLAAEQGHAEAQFSLAMSRAFGFGGLSIDVVESYKWAAIAASNGLEDAIKFQEYIAEEMTNREIETARNRAADCIKNNHKGCVGEQLNEPATQHQGVVSDVQEIPERTPLEKSKAECEELGFTPKRRTNEMFRESYDWFINNLDSMEYDKNISAHKKPVKEAILKVVRWIS